MDGRTIKNGWFIIANITHITIHTHRDHHDQLAPCDFLRVRPPLWHAEPERFRAAMARTAIAGFFHQQWEYQMGLQWAEN